MATKSKNPQQKQSQKSQEQGSKSQNPQQLRKRVNATLKRLESKDPGLKKLLEKAYGYAVFPSVGKAALVVGGSYGRGAVFEKGKMIGYATISQMTIGVQIGGDTFTEILVFHDKQPLKRFKQGHMAFAANASAVLVKAAAAGTSDFKGVSALAYSSGGMLLELALGGQKFTFKPLGSEGDDDQASKKDAKAKGRSDDDDEEESDEEGGEGGGMLSQALGGVKGAASSVGGIAKERPIVATIVGAGLVTALGLLVMRALRSSGGSQRDEEEDEESDDEDTDARASDEDDAEEEDQGEEEDEDDGGEEEEEEDEEEESSNNHVGGRRSHRYR